ncbi:MAG TPA: hypothetical protein VF310_08780 [Vicinamibacteria bacterium]
MVLTLSAVLLAATAAAPGPDARARDVLAQSRAALGGRAVRGLSLEADLRRVQPLEGGETRDISGEVTVDVQVPDHYLKVETLSPMPGGPSFSVGTGLDGQEAWRAPMGTPGGGAHIVVRVADGEGPAAAGALLRRTRAEMLRVLLLALAAAPGDEGWAFTHAGEAEAPEGRAELVEVGDGQGPVGTLFVDKASHRPLLVSFKTMAPRMQMMRAEGPREAHRIQQEAEQRRPAAPGPEVEARLYVSEWKAVDGLLLPHRLTQTIEGGASEEWTVRRWKIDPDFKPGHFKKQK